MQFNPLLPFFFFNHYMMKIKRRAKEIKSMDFGIHAQDFEPIY